MILRIGILALGALLAIGLVFGLIHLLKSTKKGAKELTEAVRSTNSASMGGFSTG